MPPAVRRTAPPAAPPPPAGVNFGDLGFYGGSFTIPEGDYALEFNVVMHAGTKQDGSQAGPERLGVMVNFYPLKGGDPLEKFLSMGSKAGDSYAPNPATGKGIVPVPGGAGGTLPRSTNWGMFLKSLYDCGLPQGIFTDDLSVLDGIHAHVQSVPEPEERKGFGGAKTGEAGVEEKRGNNLIPIVTEIKEDGKPWEGSGGFPEVAAAAPAAAAPKTAAKAPAARPAAARAAAPAPAAAAAVDTDDVDAAAINGVTAVLEANPNGCSKLLLRTSTFKAMKDNPTQAQLVIDTYFGSDDVLNGLLNRLGYKVENGQVKEDK